MTNIDSPYYKMMMNNMYVFHKAKDIVKNKNNDYYDLSILNYKKNIKFSIVMTTYNRSVQTYFTLKTIAESQCKNIQVIIVDDSNKDLLELNKLEQFKLCIYHIKIKNKFWFNPCINYNLGFQFIKGDKIIIQNAEVCHIGNVLKFIKKNIKNDEYLVFDVGNFPNMETNCKFYNMDYSYNNFEEWSKLFTSGFPWYQHPIHRNECLHFLTALTKKTFNKVKGFDYDFCMGSWYDDNEFLFRIQNSNINIINIKSDVHKIMGIHQWHIKSGDDWDRNAISNKELFDAKKKYYSQFGKFFYSTDYNISDSYKEIGILFK